MTVGRAGGKGYLPPTFANVLLVYGYHGDMKLCWLFCSCLVRAFFDGSIRLTQEHPEMQQHESNPEKQEPESLVRDFDSHIGKGDLVDQLRSFQ